MLLRRACRWHAASCVVACLLAFAVGAAPVRAAFSATATGSARAQAIQLAAPPAPTTTATGLLILTCTVSVNWSAPPAGQQYTIYRVVDGTTTAFRSNQTVAGSNVTDAFVLPGMFARNVSYFIRSSLIAASGWTRDSASTPVSC